MNVIRVKSKGEAMYNSRRYSGHRWNTKSSRSSVEGWCGRSASIYNTWRIKQRRDGENQLIHHGWAVSITDSIPQYDNQKVKLISVGKLFAKIIEYITMNLFQFYSNDTFNVSVSFIVHLWHLLYNRKWDSYGML